MAKQYQFSKNSRLLSQRAFKNLRGDALCLKTKFLRAYYKDSFDEGYETKIGISVSKKVGPAYIRNRLKRLVKENFRLSEAREKGIDVVFVVSPFLYKFVEGNKQTLASRELGFKRCLSEVLSKLERI